MNKTSLKTIDTKNRSCVIKKIKIQNTFPFLVKKTEEYKD